MARIINKSLWFMDQARTMQDGTPAWLSPSKRYYIRKEHRSPGGRVIKYQSNPWTHIQYYNLGGIYIPLASATCPHCGDFIQSKHCGDFVSCSCGDIFVDTDRWYPERGRQGSHSGLIAINML